nr:MAG TPA: hypothetical protein [Caudoviricetes sp.]
MASRQQKIKASKGGVLFLSGVCPLNLNPSFARPRAIFWICGTFGKYRVMNN